MLLKQYLSIPLLKKNLLILRILISSILFWQTIPRALAQEVKVTNQKAPICQEKQIDEREYQEPSVQKIPKSYPGRENIEFSEQDEKSCQLPGASKTSESSQPLETPETSFGENFDESTNSIDTYSSDSGISDESTNLQPSVSNQDSHDLNFSIQLNTGGGTSSDSGESFPEPDTPAPEASPPMPETALPTPESNVEQPPELPRSPLKPQQKKPYKPKADMEKPKKLYKNKKDSKRDRLNRRTNKLDKSPLEESKQVNKSERKTNPNTHRNPLKQLRDSETQNDSDRDRLPPTRRKPNAQKQRAKGYRSELHPIHQRKKRETIRPHLDRPKDSSPKIHTPRVHRQLPHSLKNRPHLHPRVRQNMSPHRRCCINRKVKGVLLARET